MKAITKTNPQPISPLIAEILTKTTDHELTTFRHGITRSATEKEWLAAAIAFFTSLRARGARYEVRTLRRSYNAAL
jgi:hypothetical protein